MPDALLPPQARGVCACVGAWVRSLSPALADRGPDQGHVSYSVDKSWPGKLSRCRPRAPRALHAGEVSGTRGTCSSQGRECKWGEGGVALLLSLDPTMIPSLRAPDAGLHLLPPASPPTCPSQCRLPTEMVALVSLYIKKAES